MAEKIKFLKVREVKDPSRAFPTDAGIDFFVPKFTSDFVSILRTKNPYMQRNIPLYFLEQGDDELIKYDEALGLPYFVLPPHERVLIPSGIHCRMHDTGRALIAANKSGVASKEGLVFGAQVVDYSYQGEIHINVINTSNVPVKIHEGKKLVQFIEMPIFTSDIEIENNLLMDPESFSTFYDGMQMDRMCGGFGHTDEKDKKDIKQINS